ncbi:LysR family transcriptional regulator [Rhodoferax sp. TH121]|uniref:LysR family transcriptional regulator n=1 Tax=Rhodoferax sp. TH121 TaxID=2022803 RepID=UPI000B973896|nr:LysR family transcriptional regulator [Rhodoferax sp. TH121]OYQ40889.1 LysR family transcriptional regulator [Rhodoferax sp. TH121]
MDQLKRMAVFAEVVAAGSLSGAARQLGMTPSAVSQHLRQLEDALGLALLHRSTRKLTLTEAGARYVEGCTAMVAAARAANQALEHHRDEPEGELRIAAPIGFGSVLATALAPLRNFPKLSLHLLMDDALVDVIAERVDIAVRVANLQDSSLVARKLGTLRAQLCASPAYLAARGWPQHPADLARHDWLGGRPHSAAHEVLQLHSNDGQVARVEVTSRASATQVTALHALCVAGWGISIVLSDDDRRALADGRLVPVLPDWRPPDYDAYAITVRRGEQPAKVRHALDLLVQHFATLTV